MSKKLFVGNLSFRMTESDLNETFSRHGVVEDCSIITDRDTGRSKGFGFVTMSETDADNAIAQLNGAEVNGRALTVNEAKPLVRKEFGSRAGGGNNRGGRSYGRY